MIKKLARKKSILFVLLFALTLGHFNAQTIQFQETDIEMPANLDTFNWSTYPDKSQDDFGYYGWIRFENTPTQTTQNELKANNFNLLAYYPNKVYLFHFPRNASVDYLQQKGAVSIIPLGNHQKMSKAVRKQQFPDWAISEDKVLLSFNYFENFSMDFILSELSKLNSVKVEKNYKLGQKIDISVEAYDIEMLTSFPFVRWIDVIAAPSVKEDIRGKSLHRSSNLDTKNPAGRQYTGEGVGVMVRDDGFVGPHIDFQGRIDNSATAGNNSGTHGDGVAGILTGAGNLNPLNRGMAAGSDLYVVGYNSSFLDSSTLNRISNGDVQITNSSFGDGCNNGYTSIARTVDQQTNTYPELLHVFSAGNSGTQNCGYGAGTGWGTITGGHKQGKNVIATANVFFNGQLVNSSSRGPATDGRIKPDITAHGQGQISTDENNSYLSFGGTSGASPGIAGIAAQLYEAYADLNNGTLPESALIKATMLNTANDYGNKGPDFSFGWGVINGLRAAMLIENGNYLDNSISQSENSTHTINVPANAKQVKIMLYWSDVEGSAGASPALVNDLDLVVTDPQSNTNLPFILNPTPNPALLDTPATNGMDRLNNMEQVVIENPTPGSYSIDVTGFNVPFGPQKYYVVYDIIEENLSITYPTEDDILVANTPDIVHWDGVNLVGDTTVEYSDDNGTTWTSIGVVPSTASSIQWNLPGQIGGNYKVRVTNNGTTAETSQSFSIAPRVSLVSFTSVCPTEATITWNPILEANSYDIYVLQDKYMEKIGETTSMSYTFPITDPMQEIWVAVAASGNTPNDWQSIRSNAVQYNDGDLFNCQLNKDISVTSINNSDSDFTQLCSPAPALISAEVKNGGSNPETNFTMIYQINNGPVIQETFTSTLNPGETGTFTFTTPVSNIQDGANILRVWNSISGDEYPQNDEQILEFNAFTTSTSLDFIEDFESTNAFSTWIFDNPDNDETWEAQSVTGADGNNTQALFLNNYFYNASGEVDSFTTEYFDLDYNGTPELQFDLAKAQYSPSLNDGLRVEVSADCGQTFTEVYFKDDLLLSTVPNYVTSQWQPGSTTDWRTETIDLTPFLGNNIVVRFSNINGYGNSTLIDNINVIKNETLSVSENPLKDAVQLYPNPTTGLINLELNTTYGNNYSLVMHNVVGQVVWQSKKEEFNRIATRSIDVSQLNAGIYFVSIQVGDAKIVKKLIKI
jgi:hypothetical protein